MDKELLQTIIIAAVALSLGLPTLRLVRQGRVSGLTAGRDGIKLDMAPLDKRDEARYYRDRRIAEVDDWLDLECREITRGQKKPLKRALRSDRLCSAALSAVTSDLLYQLYDAVNQNDFKHKLALDRRDAYRSEKLERIRQEYEEFLEDSGGAPCSDTANPTVYPAWDEIKDRVGNTVTQWSSEISDKVIDACRKKLSIYAEYMPALKAAKDEHEMEIIQTCTDKNAQYIQALGGEA